MSKLQEKPSALKREHPPALQKMNLLTFSMFAGHFCPPWIWIQIVNPDPETDPGTPLNPDPDTDPSTALPLSL
jgi:hypothetical protein